MMKNKYIDYNEVIKQIKILDFTINKKIDLLIIGSVALMLRGLNERNKTTDIDSFVYLPNHQEFSPIESHLNNDLSMSSYFNSHAYDSLHEILYSLPAGHFELHNDLKLPNINIYLPSVEMMVVFKLVAYSTNGINNVRDKDWVDLSNEKLMSLVDLDEVYNLIIMLSSKTIRLHKLQTQVLYSFEEYRDKVNEFLRGKK